MSAKNHGHSHSGSHGDRHHQAPKWKPHTDWRVWGVALMLIAMVVYVLTMDESIQPGGQGAPVPEAAP